MSIKNLAKNVLRASLESDSDEIDTDKIIEFLQDMKGVEHPQDIDKDKLAAIRLMSSAIKTLHADRKPLTYKRIAAEIDRQYDLLVKGWDKEGDTYVKTFPSPFELLEARDVLKTLAIFEAPRMAITDAHTQMGISTKSHKTLMLIMEARSGEISH